MKTSTTCTNDFLLFITVVPPSDCFMDLTVVRQQTRCAQTISAQEPGNDCQAKRPQIQRNQQLCTKKFYLINTLVLPEQKNSNSV